VAPDCAHRIIAGGLRTCRGQTPSRRIITRLAEVLMNWLTALALLIALTSTASANTFKLECVSKNWSVVRSSGGKREEH